MNRPLKFKPWNPTQSKRTAGRPATTGHREPQSITSKEPLPTVSRDGNYSPPIFTEWRESADFNPYEELRSIEDIIDEAMRSSANGIAGSSSSMPDPFGPTEVVPAGLTSQVMADCPHEKIVAPASAAKSSTSNGPPICATASTSLSELSPSLYKTPLNLSEREDAYGAPSAQTRTSDESIWDLCENNHKRAPSEDIKGTTSAL